METVMRDLSRVGQVVLFIAPMTPHSECGRPFLEAGEGDTGPALDGWKAGICAGIGAEVGSAQKLTGDCAPPRAFQLELRILGHIKGLGQPKLRPAEADVAQPPADGEI